MMLSRRFIASVPRNNLLSPVPAGFPKIVRGRYATTTCTGATREKRQMSSTHAHEPEAVAAAPATSSGLWKRFQVTAEVTVSKIFPAGFGWQAGSVVAADMGLTGTDAGFALMTGVGDFWGVFLGHSLFYSIKSLFSEDVQVTKEIHTGAFLASAAFFSGSAWQPVVNTLQSAGYSYIGVTGFTTIFCAASFFTGLRLARMALPKLGLQVAPNNYSNLKNDASLSLSIGAAGGGFVGTDVAYLPEQNFLAPAVGVQASDSIALACTKAGSATSIGFLAAQTAQNLAYSPTKNWTD